MTKRILVIVGLLLLGLGGWLVLSNQKDAQAQAAAIVAKDNSGQAVDVEQSTLKNYAATHTGGGVTVTLTAAFQRAQAQARVQSDAAASNAKLYSAAQQACSGRTDSITQARCVQDYVSKRLVAAPAPTQVAAPKASDFVFAYGSPLWTPDSAGACLLGGVAAMLMVGFMIIRRRQHER